MPPKEKSVRYDYTHHDHIRQWYLRRRFNALEWAAGLRLIRDQLARDMANAERQYPWKTAVRDIVVQNISQHAAFRLAALYLPIVRIMDDIAQSTDTQLREIITCCGKQPL